MSIMKIKSIITTAGRSPAFLAVIALVAVLAVIPSVVENRFVITLLTLSLIWALFAMSLDLLQGYTGLVSFGHAAYLATGAYTMGIATVQYGWDWLPASIVAIAATMAVAAIFGLIVSHLSGIQFVMVTFALAQVVWGMTVQWHSMTNGDNGIGGVPRPVIGALDMANSTNYYLFVLVVVLVCALILYGLVRSPFGLSMKGIKQTPSRMRVLGYNVWLHKYVTYIIAGIFAGIAGILMTSFNRFVSPQDAALGTSAAPLLMVLVGGPGTLFGPMLGATTVVILENIISGYTDRWVIVMGVIYIAVVLWLPGGILGLLRHITVRLRRALASLRPQ